MLFLLKRTVPGALAGLTVLVAAGWLGRAALGVQSPTLAATPGLVAVGLLASGALFVGDGCIHVALIRIRGDAYRRRYHELAAVFHGQSSAALLTGALMAGVGEELVFRGLGMSPVYLLSAAVAFGLLHHLRGRLAAYTLWSVWEGILLALALWLTGALVVTMVAHFLHDLIGFLIFRVERHHPRPAVPEGGA